MSNPKPKVLHDGIFVIFGITGDLSRRKLLPALYSLVALDMLSDNFKIVGVTRQSTEIYQLVSSAEQYIEESGEEVNQVTLNKLRGMISLVTMGINEPSEYQKLHSHIQTLESEVGHNLNRHYYLAVPPQMFTPIINGLGSVGLSRNEHLFENRILIEKPFGHDTASAIQLIKEIENVFDEENIYRVDHYLAKETAQNILTFRTNNPIFRSAWNCESIDHILITASEKIGIEGRVNFYDSTGAMRDLIQSHLLQLLALITMEEPLDNSAESIHKSKLELLKAIQPIKANEVDKVAVRGQYRGYKDEVGKNSLTETYAAIRLQIDNPRWRGLPVLLRTGKALHDKITEITLVFKTHNKNSTDYNTLTLRIQPNEGIVLKLRAKKPSLEAETQIVQMDFSYNDSFTSKQPDAYERVLIDALRGDKTLFTTDEEVLASWNIVEEVLQAWSENADSMQIYEPGSWGPSKAEELALAAGAKWHTHKLLP